MIIKVKEYGAAGNGKSDDTLSIQKAIDDCETAGGGRVVLSDGNFISGTIILKSHVYLEITEGAVLTASKDIEDYKENTHYNRYRNEPELDRCFIYAQDACDIGICGNGMIYGSAESFPNKNSIYRPMMIRFLRCSDIHISDIKLYHAAAWTTAFLDCSLIWVRCVDIFNDKRYNGDGLDFDGCSHVYVSDCRIQGTDDNLCLQSSSKEYPVSDVHVTNCTFTSLCAGIRIGLKSIGKISDVVISNCTMYNVWREGIKIECSEGGYIGNISINNIQMRNVTRPIFILLNNRFEPEDLGSSIELTEMPEIGTLENISISNVSVVDEEEMKNIHYRFQNDIMGRPQFAGIRMDANEKHPINNVRMTHLFYRFIGGVKKHEIPNCYPEVVDKLEDKDKKGSENYYPDWSRAAFMDIRNVKNLVLDNIYLEKSEQDERPDVLLDGCLIIKKDIVISCEK
ncbi:glycoside hydrolase family 28 protein [Kineothrix sp. MB12-C1]|uniref:glycoside hydrolase family 28 protein n=1 Tax=Kineothrix sp. MB12-C1 TaxID=3070215 RepID=UPI0027D2CC8D|nr:glycosyl hydrolase family 28 protein [Kineothrix sp. MB12-C1]WMC91946.1 glycosyl hydrolase family 28 protein [Kineothrix sp. MB12-C1]